MKMQQNRTRLKRVIRLGTAYAVTLPKDFVSGAEYLIVKETEDGLLIKKAKIAEEPPLHPRPPLRAGGREVKAPHGKQ
jgi:hypothetical protein